MRKWWRKSAFFWPGEISPFPSTRGIQSDGVTVCWGRSSRMPSSRSAWALREGEGMLPRAGSSVFLGGFVVSQGIPHCDGHIIPFLGHVFSSSFLLGLPILPGLNEVTVTSLPLNYGGCCSSFPTCRGSPSGHLAASLPDGPGAWIFEVWWIPETFLLRPSLDGTPRPCPWPHTGTWPARGPLHTRLAHTDKAVVCFSAPRPL